MSTHNITRKINVQVDLSLHLDTGDNKTPKLQLILMDWDQDKDPQVLSWCQGFFFNIFTFLHSLGPIFSIFKKILEGHDTFFFDG